MYLNEKKTFVGLQKKKESSFLYQAIFQIVEVREFCPRKEENWNMCKYVANQVNKMIQAEKKNLSQFPMFLHPHFKLHLIFLNR